MERTILKIITMVTDYQQGSVILNHLVFLLRINPRHTTSNALVLNNVQRTFRQM